MVHFTASILMMLMLVDQSLAGFTCEFVAGYKVADCGCCGTLQGVTGDVTNVQIL